MDSTLIFVGGGLPLTLFGLRGLLFSKLTPFHKFPNNLDTNTKSAFVRQHNHVSIEVEFGGHCASIFPDKESAVGTVVEVVDVVVVVCTSSSGFLNKDLTKLSSADGSLALALASATASATAFLNKDPSMPSGDIDLNLEGVGITEDSRLNGDDNLGIICILKPMFGGVVLFDRCFFFNPVLSDPSELA